jgi:NADPH:quinone reductase-like Zn-dependent oxidoreductase
MRTMISTQIMRAIQIHSYGPEQLKLEETSRPALEAGKVLVRVHAAGVNPIDWQITQGLMKDRQPVTFPFIPGIEVAGVVEEVGPSVAADLIGQAVLGQIAAGGYAEYALIPFEALALKPKTLSFIEAAAFPVGATIAWRVLFDNGGLTSGQRVLLQEATSGIGVFAVQLAKWKGAEVIGTSSTAAKLDFMRTLGADTVVDYATTPVESVVQDADLVLHAGAATLSSSLAALRPGGTLISNASLGPKEQEQVQARGIRVMTSRGATTVSLETLTRLADEGYLKVPVGKTFPLSEVQQAHAYAQSGQGSGRFVLRVVEEDHLIS